MTRLGLAASFLLLVPGLANAQEGSPPVTAQAVTIPGLPEGRLIGQAAGDNFGRSVASAGDVNGDGYDDLIVGAFDAGGASAGRAYVYYGGPTADATADLTLIGEAGVEHFGGSVAGAGDVNGDGYDDVIVGADDNLTLREGRAYVYFGGPTADATADLTLIGQVDSAFGHTVASAGDVNGDGYDDVIVGAYEEGGGAAYVFYGGVTPNATADQTLTSDFSSDYFGILVAGAGDVNGDGYDDLLVSQVGFTEGFRGRVHVYFGGSGGASPSLTLNGQASGDSFGDSVASAGDVNGDGYDDVVVGSYVGVFVYYGGPSFDATPDLTLSGGASSVANAGDVNGDGYSDILVRSGDSVQVYFGGPLADATADITLNFDAVTGNPGSSAPSASTSVASAGDFDGDGLADVIIGAPSADTPNGANSGAAYIISNANTGEGIAEWRAFGQAAGDHFGRSIASAGDVNGDGYDDVLVGAWSNDAGGTNAGRAYVYFGGPTTDDTPDLTLTGEAASDGFGGSVASAGDVNGDGYTDVIIGAPGNDAGGANAGRAYIYFGGASANATADITITGEAAGGEFGSSVAGAGDVNGDGYGDVIVGAYSNDAAGTDAGRAYVYFGGVSPDAIADLTLTGNAALDYFGASVASAGDVNGDGYGDIIVGAYNSNSGGANAGQAYLYFGGPAVNAVVDHTFTGEAAGDSFGWSVASAGDVNGDGYADVIIGANGSDATAVDAGRAYVFFGGLDADAVVDLRLSGEAVGDQFGRSVAPAGDVNGDGYADVIVSAPLNGVVGTWAGRAYVYFGGLAVDGTADQTLTGEAEDDLFGWSVASAGDVNGDGRADVIVGAWGNDSGGADAGAAYVYRATGPAAAPGLYRLVDIPGDQGGAVQIRWTRSDQETQGNANSYRVQRSEPAGISGYAWETITTVAGTMEPRYSLAASTYSDQTASNSGVTCFRVTAMGTSGELWRSVVECGASIDNLAPAAPAALVATASPDGDVELAWDEVTGEPDLADYDVFRSADATCDASDTFVGSASELTYEDDATDFGTDVWYCVAAVDVHNNRSAVTDAASANPAVLASVKLVLQGAYQAGLPGGALMRANIEEVLPMTQPYSASPWGYSGTEAIDATDTSPANGRPDVLDAYDVVDWVLVEIRTDPTISSESRAAALLLADGTLLDPSTSQPYAAVRPAAPGAYHVAVYHRSHLAAMSRYLVALDESMTDAYDLSASASLVYGTGGIVGLATGVFGLYAADGSGDGLVTAPDFNAYSAASAAGATGYQPADYTLDGLVTAPDFNLYNANAAAGASTAVPEN